MLTHSGLEQLQDAGTTVERPAGGPSSVQRLARNPNRGAFHVYDRLHDKCQDVLLSHYRTPLPAFPVLLPVLPPGRYSTTATSSISTIASGWARRLISIVVLVGVATPR